LEEAIEAAAFLANNYDAIVAPKIDFHEFNFGVSFSSRGKKSTNRIAQSYSLCAFIDCVRYAFLARKDCRQRQSCRNGWNEKMPLSGNRLVQCKWCKFKIHRDWNGARNKALSDIINN